MLLTLQINKQQPPGTVSYYEVPKDEYNYVKKNIYIYFFQKAWLNTYRRK